MNGKDYEFICEVPPEARQEPTYERTGWETIIFQLMDEEDEEE